jgi:hypothetical protein
MKQTMMHGHEAIFMTMDEFKVWMADKKVCHYQVNWIEEWISPLINKNNENIIFDKIGFYFPYQGFILQNTVKLARYPYAGYSEKCLSHETIDKIPVHKLDSWKASYNPRNKRVLVIKN